MSHIFGSIWDRTNRNALNDLSKSVEYQGKSIQDLVAEGQLTPEQYAELLQAVNGLISKGDVSVSDIDVNLGKLGLRHLSEEVLSAIVGDAPVSMVPEKGSVTLDRTAFAKPKKNMFNKNDVLQGKYLNSQTGEIISHSQYSTEDFRIIEPKKQLAFLNISMVCFYDADYKFIKAHLSPVTPETPDNAVYMRTGVLNSNINQAQVEYGEFITPYEDFKLVIDDKHILEKEMPKINIKDTNFYSPGGKNLFDKDTVRTGLTFDSQTGNIIGNSNYSVSEIIEVTGNTSYAFFRVYRAIWLDHNGDFISVVLSPYINISPVNAKYLMVSLSNDVLSTAQVEVGTATSQYESYKPVIDKDYLPNVVGNSQMNNSVIGEAVALSNAYSYTPNSYTPLNIPTYEGSGKTTHPSVLYFEDGWNGYKFWMAHTPYPNSDNQYENPSVVASNDNVTWHEPATNPIAPLLPEHGFQSDPELTMNGDTMELWFRATTGSLTEMYRMTTDDGVNWTNREKMFDNESFELVRSHSIIIENGKYMMWYTSGAVSNVTLRYAESDDGKVWDNTRTLKIDLDKRYTYWHGEVIKENDKYEMILQCQSATEGWSVFYSESKDNINWTPFVLIIAPTIGSARLDNGSLYKPSFCMVGNEYYVYYSTPSKIFLTKGSNIYALGIEKHKNNGAFNIETIKTASNIYDGNNPPGDFPTDTIIYTRIYKTDSTSGTPKGVGMLKTDTVMARENQIRQEFFEDNSNDVYKRYQVQDGWSEFELK